MGVQIIWLLVFYCCCSVAKSCPTLCGSMDCSLEVSLFSTNSLVSSDPCPMSRWCPPTISPSVASFFCPQSFPASRSFPMNQLLASGGQSIGACVGQALQSRDPGLEGLGALPWEVPALNRLNFFFFFKKKSFLSLSLIVSCLCWVTLLSDSFWPQGASVSGIFQARILQWMAMHSSKGSSQTRDRTRSPTLQLDFFFIIKPPGEPRNTGVGGLALLQGNFLTQESNPGSLASQADSLPAEPPGKLHCPRQYFNPENM